MSLLSLCSARLPAPTINSRYFYFSCFPLFITLCLLLFLLVLFIGVDSLGIGQVGDVVWWTVVVALVAVLVMSLIPVLVEFASVVGRAALVGK